MSIVLIGGHECMYNKYKEMFNEKGHKVKIYNTLPAKFSKVIGNPDVLLLLTSTVSHKMVKTAIKEAKRKSIKVFRCHNSSATAIETTIESIELEV